VCTVYVFVGKGVVSKCGLQHSMPVGMCRQNMIKSAPPPTYEAVEATQISYSMQDNPSMSGGILSQYRQDKALYGKGAIANC